MPSKDRVRRGKQLGEIEEMALRLLGRWLLPGRACQALRLLHQKRSAGWSVWVTRC
jgi:hypothetical protein